MRTQYPVAWSTLAQWLLASVIGSILTLVAGIPFTVGGMTLMLMIGIIIELPLFFIEDLTHWRDWFSNMLAVAGFVLGAGLLGAGIGGVEWLVLGRRIVNLPLWMKVGSLGITALGYTVEAASVGGTLLLFVAVVMAVRTGNDFTVYLQILAAGVIGFTLGMACTRLPLLWLFRFFRS